MLRNPPGLRRLGIGSACAAVLLFGALPAVGHAATGPGSELSQFSLAEATAPGPGGSQIVAGVTDPCNDSGGCADSVFVARYLPSGTPDPLFGGGDGFEVFQGMSSSVRVIGMTVSDDYAVTVAFHHDIETGLLRLTPQGWPDPSFGTDGVVLEHRTDFTPSDTGADGLVEDAAGRLLLAGWSQRQAGGTDFAVARYLSDGSADASFAGGGVARVADPGPSPTLAFARSLALAPDGGIVLGGDTRGIYAGHVTVAELTPDGGVDDAFGDHGTVTLPYPQPFNQKVGFATLAVTPTGEIIVEEDAGASEVAFGPCNGALLTHLSRRGEVRNSFRAPCAGQGDGLALDHDGRILFAGGEPVPPTKPGSIAVARMSTDGNVDPAFSPASDRRLFRVSGQPSVGTAITSMGADAIGVVGYVDTDRCRSSSGQSEWAPCRALVLMRLKADGSLDSGFGTGGIATAPEVYMCPTAPTLLCGDQLTGLQLRHALRATLSKTAHRSGGELHFKVTCTPQVLRACEIRATLWDGQRTINLGSKRARVDPGSSVTLDFPQDRHVLRQLSGRLSVDERIRAEGIGANKLEARVAVR